MKYQYIIAALAVLLAGCMNGAETTQAGAPVETIPDATVVVTRGNVSSGDSADTTIEVVGGNEESLREFISRWLMPMYPNESSQDSTVYIGSLPEELPLDLPLPDDARVIGSITGYWADYRLILDTGLSEEAIQDFYAQALADGGWQNAPTAESPGGFVSQPASLSAYCYGDDEAYLTVESLSMPDGHANLQLSLFTSLEDYMCGGDPSSYGPPHSDLVPSLQAPAGVQMQGGSSGGSDSSAEVSANLKTRLSTAELAEHYNEQLQAAGWEIQNQGSGGGADWSNWVFTDEKGKAWSGTLIVIGRSPDSDSRFALLRIERNP